MNKYMKVSMPVLSVYLKNGLKYWLFQAEVTKSGYISKKNRMQIRAFNQLCRHFNLNPKKMKFWWHYGNSL